MIKKTVTSIEITDTHIKLIQSSINGNNRVVQTCDIQRLNVPTEEECLKILSAMAAAHRLGAQPVVAVIPRRLAILRHLSLPSQDEHEIKKMVGLQLMNKVPYSREDIVYDYTVIGKDETGYSRVLVVLVHRDVIQRYLKMLEQAGINPYKITVSSAGLSAWLGHRHKKQGKTAPSVSAVINIDEIDAEICFCSDSKFLFSRNIQLGARDLNPEHMNNFVHQIDLTLKSYLKDKMGPAVTDFVLVSTLAEAGLLKERLESEHKKEVELASPLDDLPPSVKSAQDMTSWERSGYSVAVGLGVVLGNTDRFLNLVPAEVQDSKAISAGRKKWLRCFALSAITVVLLVAIASVDIYKQTGYIGRLQDRIKILKSESARAEKVIQVVDFVETHIKGRTIMANVMAELYRLTPEDISFKTVQLTEEKTMTVQGFAKTRSSVNSFQDRLVGSAMFDDVTLQYASRSRMLGEELTDFKITFKLSEKKGS